MKNISKDFRKELKNDNRNYLLFADLTLASGEELHLTGEQIWEGGFSIDDATSNPDSFDLGSVIIDKFTLDVNNIYDDFSKYDFTDAEVVPYVGLALDKVDESLGINLLRYTKEVTGHTDYVSGTSSNTYETDDEGLNVTTIQANGNYNSLSFYFTDISISEIEGKEVTISMWVQSEGLASFPQGFQIATGVFTSRNNRRRFKGLGGFNNAATAISSYNVQDYKDGEWVKLICKATLPLVSSMTIENTTEDYVKYGIQLYVNANNTLYPLQVKKVKCAFGTIDDPVYTIAPEDVRIEKIRMGTYAVNEPTYNGSVITLECLDNLRLFDQPYSKSTLQYPATLIQIIRDACECCGLSLLTTGFDGDDYIVENRPEDEAVTFREVVSWAAQIACKYVKCDAYGRVFLRWYDEFEGTEEYALTDNRESKLHTDAGEEILIFSDPEVAKSNINGGYFDSDTPYSSGADLDGGTFDGGEADYDAGTFAGMKNYHHIWSLFSLTVGTDDICITGVSVTAETEAGENVTYLYGDAGYVISIEQNGLIQTEEQARTVAAMVGAKLKGMTFRTFSSSHLSDPTIEAGDTAYVTDRKQNSYRTYITNTVFTAGGSQSSSCGAETPAKKGATRFTEATKALVEAKKNTQRQISTYDKAVQNLTSLITQSFGVYKTEEKLEDGSTVFYMHNKPTLGESDTIWKMAADAFAVSTDGGKTWTAGMDSSGNAVVNVLSAIGIRFDWARGGTLTLGGESNVSGVLKVLDKDGNTICTLSNTGADIVGKITSRNAENGFSCSLADGKLTITDIDGKSILQAYLAEETDMSTGTKHWYAVLQGVGSNKASIRLDGQDGEVNISAGSFKMNDVEGKSGKAEFSDGSYLVFKNGILTGGKTDSGTTF